MIYERRLISYYLLIFKASDKMDERVFTPGAAEDTRQVLDLIHRAVDKCPKEWSLRTFCHRIIGDPEVVQKLNTGRFTIRRLATIKRDVEYYIENLP